MPILNVPQFHDSRVLVNFKLYNFDAIDDEKIQNDKIDVGYDVKTNGRWGEIIQRINENEIGRYRMKIIYKSPWHVDCGAVNRGKMLTKNILLDDDIEIWTKHWTFERKRQEF
jgi:hypothetical protein